MIYPSIAVAQAEVEFFHLEANDPSPEEPTALNEKGRKLRASLMAEELREVVDAMAEGHLPEVAKELCDLIYVALGTAIAYGIDLEPVWRAVHESNMAKFGPGMTRREDGKVIKPPDWKKPDIASIIADQAI